MSRRIADELQGIDLGDKRLNDRSHKIIEALAADPQASINGAMQSWNETIATYRLLDNDNVSPEAILLPHLEATLQRMQRQPVVLIVQDTTELNYSKHPPRDAGCLNEEYRRGFYDHTHLALTPQQVCLGVVGSEQFSRTPESLAAESQRKKLPIQEKESYRWLQGYRLATQLAQQCPDTQVVSVADSEADIYEIFLEADAQEHPVDYVIRAQRPRRTPNKDPDAGPQTYCKARDEVADSPLLTTRLVDLPATKKRKARTACLEIRAKQVTLKPPHGRSSLGRLTLNIVLVAEVGGPDDGTDVEWILLTTLPIDSVAEVERLIDYYVSRWSIETYFRTLKTGCQVEEIQLETTARLRRCLAFYKIIAWRVMYVTMMNRECPDLPVDAVFADCEWMSVWKIVTREAPPTRTPSLASFMPHLASLGGYNNRATERPPGPQPIWIGIRRMMDFATAWLIFHKSNEPNCV